MVQVAKKICGDVVLDHESLEHLFNLGGGKAVFFLCFICQLGRWDSEMVMEMAVPTEGYLRPFHYLVGQRSLTGKLASDEDYVHPTPLYSGS